MDLVKASLWVCGFGTLLTLGAAGFVVYQNTGSRNLVFAAGALVGVIVTFWTYLYFELQGSIQYDHISLEYLIDRAKPEIALPLNYYKPSDEFLRWLRDTNPRRTIDTDASNWLSSNHKSEFDDLDRADQLASDFTIFSLVSFIEIQQSDWHIRRLVYRGITATASTWTGMSKPSDCSIVTREQIEASLAESHNVFAGASSSSSFRAEKICLPPASTIKIAPGLLVITNPICEISFRVSPPTLKKLAEPVYKPGKNPQPLFNGKPQYISMLLGIDVTTQFFRLRSNHRNVSRYRAWSSRIVNDARDWFRPPPFPTD